MELTFREKRKCFPLKLKPPSTKRLSGRSMSNSLENKLNTLFSSKKN